MPLNWHSEDPYTELHVPGFPFYTHIRRLWYFCFSNFESKSLENQYHRVNIGKYKSHNWRFFSPIMRLWTIWLPVWQWRGCRKSPFLARGVVPLQIWYRYSQDTSLWRYGGIFKEKSINFADFQVIITCTKDFLNYDVMGIPMATCLTAGGVENNWFWPQHISSPPKLM